MTGTWDTAASGNRTAGSLRRARSITSVRATAVRKKAPFGNDRAVFGSFAIWHRSRSPNARSESQLCDFDCAQRIDFEGRQNQNDDAALRAEEGAMQVSPTAVSSSGREPTRASGSGFDRAVGTTDASSELGRVCVGFSEISYRIEVICKKAIVVAASGLQSSCVAFPSDHEAVWSFPFPT